LLQKIRLITKLGNINNIKKRGKKKTEIGKDKTTQGFIFITSLSLKVLLGWVEVAVEDARPLPLRSSLVGIGRVVRTIFMLWEASFSLDWSLGAAGG